MRIAILGTRGIPNRYGGFEQFAEYLSVFLIKRGHEVVVYAPSSKYYKKKYYKGVKIVVINSYEKILGPFSNLIYDWRCLKHSIVEDFDLLLHLGYQSSSISVALYKKKINSILITNMDGMEWQRAKWNKPVKIFTKFAEKLAVESSDWLVSDNLGIEKYYHETYNVKSTFIPYGAESVQSFKDLDEFNLGVEKYKYFLIIARLEPENNIDMILRGFLKSNSNLPFIVIGNADTKYGNYLKQKYLKHGSKFIGSVYDKIMLDSLRHYSSIYFHGHSVGGTNPALLEAMAAKSFIAAHDNIFNKTVLAKNSIFFSSHQDVAKIIKKYINNHNGNYDSIKETNIMNNHEIIIEKYNWENITNKYENLFYKLVKENNE